MRFPPEKDEEGGGEGAGEGGLASCFTEEARRVIESTPELCYLTHVVLRMFEDLDKHEDDPTRFRIEILFSPGTFSVLFPYHNRIFIHFFAHSFIDSRIFKFLPDHPPPIPPPPHQASLPTRPPSPAPSRSTCTSSTSSASDGTL